MLVAGRERPAAAQPAAKVIAVTEIAAAALPGLPVEVNLAPITAEVDAPELIPATATGSPLLPAELAQAGAGCNLSEAVQARLRTNVQVTAALQRMPREARSVADAIMLWDGHWIDAVSVGGNAALAPIRAAVTDAVRAAPADCRDATVTGPRLLIVASSTGNQVLAFGSGQWTWAQLLGG